VGHYYFAARDASYTYQRFLQAVAKFPAVCDDYGDGRNADAICRHSLATMFAHFGQETGDHNASSPLPQWRQGLKYLRELGCDETGGGCGYNIECADPVFNKVWTCGKNADGSFKKYFGRGAKQLSYNYNYGPFSQAMHDGDQTVLLKNPDLVASTWLNLARPRSSLSIRNRRNRRCCTCSTALGRRTRPIRWRGQAITLPPPS